MNDHSPPTRSSSRVGVEMAGSVHGGVPLVAEGAVGRPDAGEVVGEHSAAHELLGAIGREERRQRRRDRDHGAPPYYGKRPRASMAAAMRSRATT